MKLHITVAATVALVLLFATIQTTPAAAAEEEEQESTVESIAESTAEAITEPPIKLVHVLNPGEREYLSPNLIGVQNIAMTFLPLSMNFVNIIDAFREIVNGVRYEILLNAVDTKSKDADTICRLVILEQPWLTTQWGDKHRELINSNCSDVADNALPIDAEQRSKALNDKYVSNSIFNGGQRNELSDSEMSQLEAQILTDLPRRTTTTTTTSSTSTTVSGSPPQAEATNEPTTSINVINANEAATVTATPTATATATAPATASATSPAPVPTVESSTMPTEELNDNEKRWLDDFLSVSAYSFEKTIEQQRSELKQQQQQQQQGDQREEEKGQEQQQQPEE